MSSFDIFHIHPVGSPFVRSVNHADIAGPEYFQQLPFPVIIFSADANQKSRRHYLNTKNGEYEFCRSSSISGILQNLQTSGKIAENLEKIHPFDHLKKWGNVLSG